MWAQTFLFYPPTAVSAKSFGSDGKKSNPKSAGPVLTGVLDDATGSYALAFSLVAGLFVVASGLIAVVGARHKAAERRRRKKRRAARRKRC